MACWSLRIFILVLGLCKHLLTTIAVLVFFHSLLNEAQPFGDKTKSKDQERLNRAGLLEGVDKVKLILYVHKRCLDYLVHSARIMIVVLSVSL